MIVCIYMHCSDSQGSYQMNMIGFDMGTSLPFISSNSTCWTAACVYNGLFLGLPKQQVQDFVCTPQGSCYRVIPWFVFHYTRWGNHLRFLWILIWWRLPISGCKTFRFLICQTILRKLNYQENSPSLTWIVQAQHGSCVRSIPASDNDSLDHYGSGDAPPWIK